MKQMVGRGPGSYLRTNRAIQMGRTTLFSVVVPICMVQRATGAYLQPMRLCVVLFVLSHWDCYLGQFLTKSHKCGTIGKLLMRRS